MQQRGCAVAKMLGRERSKLTVCEAARVAGNASPPPPKQRKKTGGEKHQPPSLLLLPAGLGAHSTQWTP